jgi:hypothetical protein
VRSIATHHHPATALKGMLVRQLVVSAELHVHLDADVA